METERLAVELGKRVRQLRSKARLSQVTFSAMTGFTQGFVSKLEAGKVELGIGSLRRISAALDITLAMLFRGL